jgi:hypothetical protein
MPNTVHVGLVKFDPDLVSQAVDLPEVDPGSYTLVDNDGKSCRRITDDDLAAWSVDNHIASFRLLDINWLTLDVDNQTLSLTYESGATARVVLGSIADSTPGPPPFYGQSNGIIYPIDESGNLLLNGSTTPNLVAIRAWYHGEAKRVNDQRLQVAEVAHAFTDIIGNVSNLPQ